ncbi:hypothetical protein ACJ41O_006644 [Fusarium nematophilum]
MNANSPTPAYVAVYERKEHTHRGDMEFMRHGSILVEKPDGEFHCFGGSGIYQLAHGWGDPDDKSVRLLAINPVTLMPKTTFNGILELIRSAMSTPEWVSHQFQITTHLDRAVKGGRITQAERDKEAEEQSARRSEYFQNWVPNILGAMMEKGFITEAEKKKAKEDYEKACTLPLTEPSFSLSSR